MKTKRKTMRWLLSLCVMTFVLLGGAVKANAACKHNPVIYDLAAQPSCTRTGAYRMICTKCLQICGTQEIQALGHKTVDGYANPDCVHPGGKTKVCTVCDKQVSIISDQPPLGHNYVASSCTKDECTRCGDKRDGGFGHTPVENKIEQYPSCTKVGVRSLKCKTCGAGMGSETISKTEHVTARAYVDPTCDEAGYWKTYCTQCNSELSKTTDQPPLGHNYSKHVSCTEPYVCTRCEQPDPTGKAAGHNYQGGDCETPGICTYCSAKEIRVIPGSHVFDKPLAACTDRKCKKCNKVIKATKEHSYSTSSCLEVAKCIFCGAKDPKGAKGKHEFTTNDDVPLCMADRECLTCGYVDKGTKKEHQRWQADMATHLVDDPDAARYHGFDCIYCGEYVKVPHVNNLVALEGRDEHVHACYDSSCPADTCQTSFDSPAKCSYVSKYYGFNYGKQGKSMPFRMVVRSCTVCKVVRIDINRNLGNEGLHNGSDAITEIGKMVFSTAIGQIMDDFVPGASGNIETLQFGWELVSGSYRLLYGQSVRGSADGAGFVDNLRILCLKNGLKFVEYKNQDEIDYDFQDFDYNKNTPIYDLKNGGSVINYNWLY